MQNEEWVFEVVGAVEKEERERDEKARGESERDQCDSTS